jgi:hypothetical protein
MRDSLVKWQPAPDPSTSHNFASDRQHKGTSEWFIKDNKFGEWMVSGSLFWIYGKREPLLLVMVAVILRTICNMGFVAGSGKSVLWFVSPD